MARKVQLSTDQFQQSASAHRETKEKYSANLRVMQNQIQMIRKEHLFTKDFYTKEIQTWKSYFQTTESTLQKGTDRRTIFLFRKIHCLEIQTILQRHSKQTNSDQQQLKYNAKSFSSKN